MNNSKHPPIPPNCNFFLERPDGTIEFRTTDIPNVHNLANLGMKHWDDDRYSYWRPIIAAISRCGWLDEASRLYPSGGDFRKDLDSANKYDVAKENAEARERWGEEK